MKQKPVLRCVILSNRKLVFFDESQKMIGHHSKLPLIQQLVDNPENIIIVINFLEENYDIAVKVLVCLLYTHYSYTNYSIITFIKRLEDTFFSNKL